MEDLGGLLFLLGLLTLFVAGCLWVSGHFGLVGLGLFLVSLGFLVGELLS